MDTLTREKRSWNMSRIRGRDTGPELAVRSLLHRMGFRFRLHSADLPGRPDIVLAKWRAVVLVHGCFWHRHPGCQFAYTPRSRGEFWNRKFQQNVARDKLVRRRLRSLGWRVLVVWECQTRFPDKLARRLRREITGESARAGGSGRFSNDTR